MNAVPHCGATWPNLGPAGGEWICTLDRGHDGDHQAHGKVSLDPCRPLSTAPRGGDNVTEASRS